MYRSEFSCSSVSSMCQSDSNSKTEIVSSILALSGTMCEKVSHLKSVVTPSGIEKKEDDEITGVWHTL